MRIGIVTPAPPGSQSGNRVTALRWAKVLRALGHQVVVVPEYQSQHLDVLVALHARKSAASVARFCRRRPGTPTVVALTGTDLYRDIHRSRDARQSLRLATRLIVLQRRGVDALPEAFRAKARVIYQSVDVPRPEESPRNRTVDVCVLGHLRPVKDPFRTAMAARLLPASSRIRVNHYGAALTLAMAERAQREIKRNARYRWYGEIPRRQVLRRLARSRILVLTSRMEGGANAVGEAIALDVPVISSQIDGSMGILGERYPGYFPFGDTRALATLLLRMEEDSKFYRKLRSWCRALTPMFSPERERVAWRRLLREVVGYPSTKQ